MRWRSAGKQPFGLRGLAAWLVPLAAGAAACALYRARTRYSFRGRVVVVTGASRGLGLLLARELVAREATVVINARDGAELQAAREELRGRGGKVEGFTADVSDASHAGLLVREVIERFGRIDVLINNAGILQVAPLANLSLADFEAAQASNFWGMVHTSLAALTFMRRRGEGRIVNVTSIGGAVAVPHLLPYSAAKFAALGFSEGLSAEAARDGVRVTTVVPGPMRTGSFVNALVKGQRAQEMTWFSVASALPVLSMDARRAARRILAASARGQTFLTVGLPAKLLRLLHGILPGTTGRLLGLANKLLPGPGNGHPHEVAEPGWQHRTTRIARSFLTALGNKAARENREVRWARPTSRARLSRETGNTHRPL
jgi:NAD(P)-dependent dehydrogenase (short-subunit alcohol dehydrogenase family)